MADRSEPSSDTNGCPKCGHDRASPTGRTKVTTGSISTTGSGLSKMFDVQTNRFETVTCASCGYTEFYKDVGNAGSDFVDVFLG